MLDRTYELAPHEAYLHGSFTQPEFRRQGIQRAASFHRLHVLRELGFRRALGLVDPRNRLANRTDPKTGYTAVGVSGLVELFGVRFYYHRDGGAFSALRRHAYWRRM
jgi:GNAT superfamily N-acetyltransferase